MHEEEWRRRKTTNANVEIPWQSHWMQKGSGAASIGGVPNTLCIKAPCPGGGAPIPAIHERTTLYVILMQQVGQ